MEKSLRYIISFIIFLSQIFLYNTETFTMFSWLYKKKIHAPNYMKVIGKTLLAEEFDLNKNINSTQNINYQKYENSQNTKQYKKNINKQNSGLKRKPRVVGLKKLENAKDKPTKKPENKPKYESKEKPTNKETNKTKDELTEKLTEILTKELPERAENKQPKELTEKLIDSLESKSTEKSKDELTDKPTDSPENKPTNKPKEKETIKPNENYINPEKKLINKSIEDIAKIIISPSSSGTNISNMAENSIPKVPEQIGLNEIDFDSEQTEPRQNSAHESCNSQESENSNESSNQDYITIETEKRSGVKTPNNTPRKLDKNQKFEKSTRNLPSNLKENLNYQMHQQKGKFQQPKTLIKTKSSNKIRDNDIDYSIKDIKKVDKKNKMTKIIKKILGISGAIAFLDIRNFTFFSNKSPDEVPAIFMSEISDCTNKVVSDWGGEIISVPGDAYVAIFPKKKTENTLKESAINATLCSIELTCKMTDTMNKNKIMFRKINKDIPYPEKFDLGIETGNTYFYKIKDAKLAPIAGVSKTINNAQRLEDHGKKSKDRKITISKKTYELLKSFKEIKNLFYLESLMDEKGVDKQFVRSCPLNKIKEFYESERWEDFKDRFNRTFKGDINSLTENI